MNIPLPPTKTIIGYKLFRTKKTHPGKLFPLFIGANEATPLGTWIEAKDIPTKGFSRRPGWHLGTIPSAPHLLKKDGTLDKSRVWAEVEAGAIKINRVLTEVEVSTILL